MAEILAAACIASVLAYASAPQSRQIVASGQSHTPTPIPGHTNHELRDIGRHVGSMPIDIPDTQPRQDEPPSLPYDGVGDIGLFADGDRMTLMNRPHIYQPKVEVGTEPVKVQRNPIYPDDLRAYDQSRSRAQAELVDASNRNYRPEGFHIPYQPQNATHQEVAQDANLAGRMHSVYLDGSQDINGVIANDKDPTASVVRRRADHIDGDRSRYQTHDRRQYGGSSGLIGHIQQEAVPMSAVIHQPDSRVYVTKTRTKPKYLNPVQHLHGNTRVNARTQRAEIGDINTMRKKRLLLVGDQGHVSSQVTFFSGHGVDGDALQYPATSRRREILPSMQFPGLYNNTGTGFTFRDRNSGNTNTSLRGSYGEVQTRDKLVSGLTPYTHTIGQSFQFHDQHPYVAGQDDDRDVRTDNIKQYRLAPAFNHLGEPVRQSDEAHNIFVPLLR